MDHPGRDDSSRLIAAVVPLVPAWRLDRSFDYEVPPELEDTVRLGSLVRVPLGHRNTRGFVTQLHRASAGSEQELQRLKSVVVEYPLAPPPLIDLVEWVARRYVVPLGRAFERMVPPRVRVTVGAPPSSADDRPPDLVNSYDGGRDLVRLIETGGAGTFCFRPLPTEDRGRLISELVAAATRADDGAALVALPEVSYGSGVLETLQQRWPHLARVDSTVPDPERARALVSLAAGHPLGVGGRAAVLAPASRLRLLIVEEEHHVSYKEDRSPRYDARRVAVRRAGLQQGICVLISGTPSLPVGFAAATGRFGLVCAPREQERSAHPIVEVLDHPEQHALSRPLHRRIRDALGAGEKVALLVPAKGYARAVWCAACRRSVRCPICEAGLFFERSTPQVRCSRCGYQATSPDRCVYCDSTDFRYIGAGSERLAEQVSAAFPRAVVARMDPDVFDPGSSRRSQPDIYVTTWIGTKLSLRPKATLVAVLDADVLIRRADFRAAENAYQALEEMARWAGPAAEGGRLVVQTRERNHHCIQAVVRADYNFFLERELVFREELGYPPYADLVKLTASGDQTDLLQKAAAASEASGGRVLGPILRRVRGASGAPEEQLEMLVKCRDAEAVAIRLRGILIDEHSGARGRLRVDVDPR